MKRMPTKTNRVSSCFKKKKQARAGETHPSYIQQLGRCYLFTLYISPLSTQTTPPRPTPPPHVAGRGGSRAGGAWNVSATRRCSRSKKWAKRRVWKKSPQKAWEPSGCAARKASAWKATTCSSRWLSVNSRYRSSTASRKKPAKAPCSSWLGCGAASPPPPLAPPPLAPSPSSASASASPPAFPPAALAAALLLLGLALQRRLPRGLHRPEAIAAPAARGALQRRVHDALHGREERGGGAFRQGRQARRRVPPAGLRHAVAVQVCRCRRRR